MNRRIRDPYVQNCERRPHRLQSVRTSTRLGHRAVFFQLST